MAIDSTVELYQATNSITSDGTIKPTYTYSSPNATITADVQPKGLTQAQLALWGLNIQQQDAKVVYDFSLSPYWAVCNQARVDGTDYYRILSVNPWPSHLEIILVPEVWK